MATSALDRQPLLHIYSPYWTVLTLFPPFIPLDLKCQQHPALDSLCAPQHSLLLCCWWCYFNGSDHNLVSNLSIRYFYLYYLRAIYILLILSISCKIWYSTQYLVGFDILPWCPSAYLKFLPISWQPIFFTGSYSPPTQLLALPGPSSSLHLLIWIWLLTGTSVPAAIFCLTYWTPSVYNILWTLCIVSTFKGQSGVRIHFPHSYNACTFLSQPSWTLEGRQASYADLFLHHVWLLWYVFFAKR